MPRHLKSNYSFTVEWGGTGISFIEVSGLNIIVDVNEYRDGNDPAQVSHKMPGHTHYSNIVLKRAIVKGNNDFFVWMSTTNLNTVERRDIVIKLLNEKRKPVIAWRAIHAFPVRYSVPALNATSNDVVIEELELAHEGLLIDSD